MNQKYRIFIYLGLVLFHAFSFDIAAAELRVYFSPPFNGERRIVEYILESLSNAKTLILIQQYQLTEPSLISALIEAQNRGVKIEAIFDKSMRKTANILKKAGIPVFFDTIHIAHNKVLIIDDKLVICGSFNLTRNANLRNCENAVFLDDPQTVQRFIMNFWHRIKAAHSLN
jgi:phosphatidylserine/phosphatidylglycerophosphate/cardiolipin synthase-like enzyme